MKTLETPKDETKKESYGFDPKEKTKAYEVLVAWLEKRTLSEKQTAIILSELLQKQQLLPDVHIGDRLYKQWRQDVLSTVSNDTDSFCPEEENFCRGFLAALITISEY